MSSGVGADIGKMDRGFSSPRMGSYVKGVYH